LLVAYPPLVPSPAKAAFAALEFVVPILVTKKKLQVTSSEK
jgi:hypothetical protein